MVGAHLPQSVTRRVATKVWVRCALSMAASLSCVPTCSSVNLSPPSLTFTASSISGILGILLESTGNYYVFEKVPISSSFGYESRIIDLDVSFKLSAAPPTLLLSISDALIGYESSGLLSWFTFWVLTARIVYFLLIVFVLSTFL